MELTLAPETQRLVEEKLSEGCYPSVDDLVKAAIQALNEQELISLTEDELDGIDRAEQAIERGEVHDLEDVVERIREMFKSKAR